MKTAHPHPQLRKPTVVRRAEIADAAMRVIAAQGARHFTARALAQEVGITDGAVFRHFATMEAIVAAGVERMETVLFSEPPPTQADPIERLGAFFRARVAALAAHPHLARLLFSDHLGQLGGPEQARRIDEFKARTRRFIAACLEEARQRGLLAEGVGPRECAVIVQGAVFALGHGGGRGGGVEKDTKAVWKALETLLRGAGHGTSHRRTTR
jgi:AcrR family transcriptional regulator